MFQNTAIKKSAHHPKISIGGPSSMHAVSVVCLATPLVPGHASRTWPRPSQGPVLGAASREGLFPSNARRGGGLEATGVPTARKSGGSSGAGEIQQR